LHLSDLDRLAAENQQHRRSAAAEVDSSSTITPATLPASLQEQLAPARLVPALPQISHVLARLRTPDTLHASAAQFGNTLSALEGDQRQSSKTLDALNQVFTSLKTDG
jgi:nuclear migration protein JNM1